MLVVQVRWMVPDDDTRDAPAATPRDERLDAVEFKLAHLERAVQELSDVVYRQQRQIDGLLDLQRGLREQLEDLIGRTDDAAPVELPPHY
jgi:uncharacterized coiled-coil protein SlyX